MSEAEALAGRLIGNGHELLQRVYFEDTDFSGLVYHARYLQFMERGRSDYLRLLGVHHSELAKEGLSFAVARMAIEFRRPARIDDVVRVVTRPIEVGGARLRLDQAVFRGETQLVGAEVTIALVGAGGKARRLPAAIRAAFATSGVS